jgi:hypothetical protein
MRNVGDEVLDVSSLTASPEGPAEVVAISGLADINPDGFAVLTLQFLVTEPGEATVTVEIDSNDPDTPAYVFDLVILATAPELIITDALTVIDPGDTITLPRAEVGDAVGKALTVRNTGDGPLVLDPVEPVSVGDVVGTIEEFEANVGTDEVAPDGFAVLPIGFVVPETGDVQVEVVVKSNDPQNPTYAFFLEVEVVEPVVEPPPEPSIRVTYRGNTVSSGDTIELGEITVGDAVREVFEIANFGDATLEFEPPRIEGVVVTPGAANNVGQDVDRDDVPPGESATLEVSFTPTAEGYFELRIVIHSNDPDLAEFVFTLAADFIEEIVAPPDNNNGQNTQNGSCGNGLVMIGPFLLLPLWLRGPVGFRSRRSRTSR